MMSFVRARVGIAVVPSSAITGLLGRTCSSKADKAPPSRLPNEFTESIEVHFPHVWFACQIATPYDWNVDLNRARMAVPLPYHPSLGERRREH
jgi:hypothetical protein